MLIKVSLLYFLLFMVCFAGPAAGDDYTWTKLFSGENSIFFMTVYGDELWHFSGRYLSRYNLDTHLSRSFDQDDGLLNPFPDQMAEGPDGALWVAGSNGISRYEGDKFTSYPRSLGPVSDMDFDDTGKLWLLCSNEGLVTFDISGYHADPIEGFAGYDYPEAMSFDQDGALWVSFAHYDNGFSLVSRYDGASWQDYTVEDGLPHKYIQNMEQGKDGALWFSFPGGVSRYDGDSWSVFTVDDGLVGNSVRNISIAPDGSVWLSFEDDIGANYTTDNGATWHTTFTSLNRSVDSFAFGKDGSVYLSSGVELHWSGGNSVEPSGPPELIFPENFSFVPMNEETVFTWEPVPGATAYEIQIPSINGSVYRVEDTKYIHTETEEVRKGDIQKRWRVRTVVNGESSEWSPQRHFYSVLPPVDQSAPADMTYIERNTDVTFSWAPCEGAESYEVQFSTISDFSGAETMTINGNSLTRNAGSGYFPVAPNRWRVRAIMENQLSEWSLIRSYYTEPLGGDTNTSIYLGENSIRDIEFHDGMVWCATGKGIVIWDPLAKTYAKYTMIDGLAHHDVRDITFAPNGDVWVATAGGVCLFDGFFWHTWSERNGLDDNDVTSVAVSQDGTVWAGLFPGGLEKYSEGTWENIKYDDQRNQILLSSFVRALAIGQDGVLWIGTRNGLTRFDGNDYQKFLGGFDIWGIHGNEDGSAWIVHSNGSLLFDGTIQKYNDGANARSIDVDKNKNVWVAYLFSIDKFWNDEKRTWFSNSGAIPHGVICIAIGPDDVPWAGTGQGLFTLDEGERWKPFFTKPEPVGLMRPSDMDKVSNVSDTNFSWSGFPGVEHYEVQFSDSPEFNDPATFTVNENKLDRTIDQVYYQDTPAYWRVRAIRKDSEISDWSVVWRFYTQDMIVTSYYSTTNGLIHNSVYDLAVTSNGNVWAATEGGVSFFDGNNWTSYNVEDGLADNYVHSVAIDDDVVWFGTNGGISRYNGDTWVTYTTVDGLPDNTIHAMVFDLQENLWIGTPVGVSMFDGGIWTNYSLDASNVVEMDIAPDGNVWVASLNAGVWCFNGSSWKRFSEAEGLPGQYIRCIEVDHSGTVWASVGKSVFYSEYCGVYSFDGEIWTLQLPDITIDLTCGPDEKLYAITRKSYEKGTVITFDGSEWKLDASIIWAGSYQYYIRNLVFGPGNIAWAAGWYVPSQEPNRGVGVASFGISKTTGIEEPVKNELTSFSISGNYPNPFNQSTTITFTLPETVFAELVVYNVTGQKVRTITAGKKAAGVYSVVWDSCNDMGTPLSSGVYFSRLNAGGQTATGRMLLIK